MNIFYLVAFLLTFFLIKVGYAVSAPLTEKKVWVTLDRDVLQNKKIHTLKSWQEMDSSSNVVMGEISSTELSELSTVMHHEFHRCGGFMAFESEAEAQEILQSESTWKSLMSLSMFYELGEQARVEPLLLQINESNILEMIKTLSAYQTRYYQSPSGKAASLFLRDEWQKLAQGRSDMKVELVTHKSWAQHSVILTIEGSDPVEKNDIVILGGHLDSIAGMFGGSSARAPGADDNASGIAVLTETIRVLVENGYRPKKTLQFMGYAAEEAGLLGSKEIAAKYKQESKSVFGVLQLDMTNFKGSQVDIGLISDYTNAGLNQFLAKLIDTYVKVPWQYTRCGYACSDHASWTTQGFPSAFPFEALKEGMNQKIHTAGDLLEVSRSSASHASKFAKLALSFAVEMAK